MSKRQKLSFVHFEDLPNEILLEIFFLLDFKGVVQCGQVSKRLRAISNDESFWSKLNLFGKNVPYSFIERAVQNGCEYLNLGLSCVQGGKKSKVPWKLKYLEISQSSDKLAQEMPKGVLENCRYLQKLALNNFILNSYDIEQICQNGQTLQILSLEGCNIDYHHRTELIQKLFSKCPQLTELNMNRGVGASTNPGHKGLLKEHVCALVDNLTPNILKLQLGAQPWVQNQHVNTLAHRCNKITEIVLSATTIGNGSGKSIANLNSLEKLDVEYTFFSPPIQSISKLKILRFGSGFHDDAEEIKNLKLQFPHISINEEYLHIAHPYKSVNGYHDQNWLWEIRAEQQTLFSKAQ